jgi:putative ABC transport system permease protein
MTLASFVRKNAFRNKRRTSLTVLSIAFSLLLLTLMMTIWRAFYMTEGSAESAQRLITRNKVSLVFFLPAYYREKIRAIPGVTHVVNQSWFGGQYKDQKPENMFMQFGTDPQEFFEVYKEFSIAPDQIEAWQKDRAGCVVDSEVARKHNFKVGDKLYIKGVLFPVNLDLTIRGIFKAPTPTDSIYFDSAYLQEGYAPMKGREGFFAIVADSPQDVPRVAKAVDEEFHNVERPTKTESEHAFQLGWIAMMGNVKAFILSICLAVVFAILLVSANTMAMSIRERTREVAVLKTLGFTQGRVLGLFVGEAVIVALVGGLIGVFIAAGLIRAASNAPGLEVFLGGVRVTGPTMAVALLVAAFVGFVSAFIPAYNASRGNIVEGLRHIG